MAQALINTVANPITALTLERQAVFRRPDVKLLCLAILEETVAVARADGARLVADEPGQILATLLTYPPDAGTSMYFDRLAGRPLEVEALTGAIVTSTVVGGSDDRTGQGLDLSGRPANRSKYIDVPASGG